MWLIIISKTRSLFQVGLILFFFKVMLEIDYIAPFKHEAVQLDLAKEIITNIVTMIKTQIKAISKN